MSDFYVDVMKKLIRRGVLCQESKILVVCGGPRDRDALMQCGFTNVVISNLDSRMRGTEFAPLEWSYQNAESLKCEDESFDAVVAHSGLHHCRSPHRALLEMYRVARAAAIVFEPMDNATTRMGVRLGLGQEYEVAAVAGNGCKFGGLENGPIPNYVFRWSEREVEKTICSYAPTARHRFLHFYRTRFPWERSELMRSKLLRVAFLLISPLVMALTWLFKRQANNLAFVVLKPKLPADLHPWLKQEDGQVQLNEPWLLDRYCDMPSGVPAAGNNGQSPGEIFETRPASEVTP